jgi:hypothetical protein
MRGRLGCCFARLRGTCLLHSFSSPHKKQHHYEHETWPSCRDALSKKGDEACVTSPGLGESSHSILFPAKAKGTQKHLGRIRELPASMCWRRPSFAVNLEVATLTLASCEPLSQEFSVCELLYSRYRASFCIERLTAEALDYGGAFACWPPRRFLNQADTQQPGCGTHTRTCFPACCASPAALQLAFEVEKDDPSTFRFADTGSGLDDAAARR